MQVRIVLAVSIGGCLRLGRRLVNPFFELYASQTGFIFSAGLYARYEHVFRTTVSLHEDARAWQ